MSPTRRSLVKTAAATIAAASFTWPATSRADAPTFAPDQPTELMVCSPTARANGWFVWNTDGSVDLQTITHDGTPWQTLRTFEADETMTTASFMQTMLELMQGTYRPSA